MFEIESSALGRIVVAAGASLFYTTRDFSGRLDRGAVAQISHLIRERFGLEAILTTCNQVHGTTVRQAVHESTWRECDSCDALFTAERGVALGIKVADCLPVTLVDLSRSLIANVHSGWRGAVQGVTSSTLDALQRNTSFDPVMTSAYLGPSIRVCCFEVGDEVAAQFDPRFVDLSRVKPHVDLPGLTAQLLRDRGFTDARILDSGLCTRCEGSIFHSFRRDGGRGGRNLAIVAL